MTTLGFPSIPGDLQNKYPGFTVDSLRLDNAGIWDYSTIISYDDYIRKVFISGNYIANIVSQYSGLTCYPHALPPPREGKNGEMRPGEDQLVRSR